MLHSNLPRRRVVAPVPLSQRFNHRHENTQNPFVIGQPMFLHPAQSGGGSCVTGQNDQITSMIKENLHRLGGAAINIIRVAHPVRRVFVVAKVDCIQIGHPLVDRVIDRQPTQTTVKNSDCHAFFPYCAQCPDVTIAERL